jgi:hypothetical protein
MSPVARTTRILTASPSSGSNRERGGKISSMVSNGLIPPVDFLTARLDQIPATSVRLRIVPHVPCSDRQRPSDDAFGHGQSGDHFPTLESSGRVALAKQLARPMRTRREGDHDRAAVRSSDRFRARSAEPASGHAAPAWQPARRGDLWCSSQRCSGLMSQGP